MRVSVEPLMVSSPALRDGIGGGTLTRAIPSTSLPGIDLPPFATFDSARCRVEPCSSCSSSSSARAAILLFARPLPLTLPPDVEGASPFDEDLELYSSSHT